ncbi:hypothetical protein AK812_SmicGene37187, partial [Symbiodinium microadriaticum]
MTRTRAPSRTEHPLGPASNREVTSRKSEDRSGAARKVVLLASP